MAIPVAVKLSPYYSSVAHLAARLDGAGVDGLVLFNRFFQPDIDIGALEMVSRLKLSDPIGAAAPARLAGHPLRSGACDDGGDPGCTGRGRVKAIMRAPARSRPSRPADPRAETPDGAAPGAGGLAAEREYRSLAQMKGSMSLLRCPDPSAYQRQNYMRLLQDWRP